MSYTPDTGGAVVLNFFGTYTPDAGDAVVLSPATGLAFASLLMDQSWVLHAPDQAIYLADQSWGLLAPAFSDATFDSAWQLQAPEFASSLHDQSWALQVPEFASALFDQGWALQAADVADAAFDAQWSLLARTIADVAIDQQWRLEATAVWTTVISSTAYLFALEQGEDRAEIPISNFSMQLRSGEPSYLQASIPNAWAWAETVAAYATHADSEMVINAGYRWSDDSYTTQEIARVTLRNVRYDYGARSASVSLDGTDTRTNATPASHVLTGASYLNQDSDGRLRYRVTPNFAVRPGDTVTVGNDTFVVGELSYQVSATGANMEVAELVDSE